MCIIKKTDIIEVVAVSISWLHILKIKDSSFIYTPEGMYFSELTINNIKKDCIAYKFLYGGCYKLLTLEIPEECFIDEINYSKIALELIASTFKII